MAGAPELAAALAQPVVSSPPHGLDSSLDHLSDSALVIEEGGRKSKKEPKTKSKGRPPKTPKVKTKVQASTSESGTACFKLEVHVLLWKACFLVYLDPVFLRFVSVLFRRWAGGFGVAGWGPGAAVFEPAGDGAEGADVVREESVQAHQRETGQETSRSAGQGAASNCSRDIGFSHRQSGVKIFDARVKILTRGHQI